jgi:hypothetical protein
MYCRQRRHLYYGGQIYKYYLPPSTAALPSKEGCAVKHFKRNIVHTVYNRKNPKSSLYCEMSMVGTPTKAGATKPGATKPVATEPGMTPLRMRPSQERPSQE